MRALGPKIRSMQTEQWQSWRNIVTSQKIEKMCSRPKKCGVFLFFTEFSFIIIIKWRNDCICASVCACVCLCLVWCVHDYYHYDCYCCTMCSLRSRTRANANRPWGLTMKRWMYQCNGIACWNGHIANKLRYHFPSYFGLVITHYWM